MSVVRKGDLKSVRVFNDRTKFVYPRYGEWKVIWFGNGIIALDEKSFTDSELEHDILVRYQMPRHVAIMEKSEFNQKKVNSVCKHCGFPTWEYETLCGSWMVSMIKRCLACGKEVAENESGV